ncbi:MAG: hypothetical protein WBY93_07220 [Candidatus Binatus sp.]
MLIAEGERDPVRRAFHLVFKEPMDANVIRIWNVGLVEIDWRPFFEIRSRKYVCQVAQPRFRLHDYMLEKGLKVFAKPNDGRVIEQFGIVPYRNRQRLGRFDYQQHQVQRCGPVFQRKRFQDQSTGVHGRPCFPVHECGRALLREAMGLVEHEHGLANRRAAKVARRL